LQHEGGDYQRLFMAASSRSSGLATIISLLCQWQCGSFAIGAAPLFLNGGGLYGHVDDKAARS
jgi:hypothetical protein